MLRKNLSQHTALDRAIERSAFNQRMATRRAASLLLSHINEEPSHEHDEYSDFGALSRVCLRRRRLLLQSEEFVGSHAEPDNKPQFSVNEVVFDAANTS